MFEHGSFQTSMLINALQREHSENSVAIIYHRLMIVIAMKFSAIRSKFTIPYVDIKCIHGYLIIISQIRGSRTIRYSILLTPPLLS